MQQQLQLQKPDYGRGGVCGPLCGEADPLQPPSDGFLRPADAGDGPAPDGRDGETSSGGPAQRN